jgi:NTE family protein
VVRGRYHPIDGFTVVLGGGGAVGMAYHCGTLQALVDEGGLALADARVMIGTSAGSIVAAELCVGRSLDHIGRTIELDARDGPLRPAWRSAPEMVRRAVGSGWIMARSSLPVPMRTPEPPDVLQRIFPGSLLSTDRSWAVERFPAEWPAGELWTVAFDLDRGTRVVLRGGDQRPRATLPQAIQASCAVPGLFPPVRIDGRRFVDGGIHSVANLDLALRARSRVVIALSPMGFDPRLPPRRMQALRRLQINNQIEQEADGLRRRGMTVLLLRPTAHELAHHGTNILSRAGSDRVIEAAYDATVERLRTPAIRHIVDLAREAVRGQGSPCAS